MDNHQLINQVAAASNQEVHIIEDESEDQEGEQQGDDGQYMLEDALEAWKEINSLVRNIGRSLLAREVAGLKRSADNITQRCGQPAPPSEHEAHHDGPACSPSSPASKRRRVSGFEEIQEARSAIQENEKEILMKRMARMRRMNKILVNLNSTHGQLESEIRGMIAESEES